MIEEKRLQKMVSTYREMIAAAKDEREVGIGYGLWIGFITALRWNEAIDAEEYGVLYDEILIHRRGNV